MADKAVETKLCTNCKKDISASNFTMHEMHCRRHIVLCEHCREPVPRSDMEEHFNDFHAKVSCTLCGDQVEKPALDDHMENTCRKKPARCPYCELELPQSDVTSHQDYCGTRTEPCVKCGQFVMMKDQLQHEVSNCTYPTPKPSSNGQSADSAADIDFPGLRFEFADSGFGHPFAMDELSRMMDESRIHETLNSRADIPGYGKRRTPVAGVPSRSYTNNNTTRSRKSTTNRKSELNKQRQRVAEPEPPENVDADTDMLLAMRLQQEDNQELDSIIRHIEKQSVSQPPVSPLTDSPPANVNTYPDDDELIPCEFCGEPFPVDILVQHQSGCDPLSTGQWNDDVSWRGERNNEVQGGPRGRGVSIPVINNLDTDWTTAREIPIQREWETPPDSPTPNMMDEGGEVILPCEFCDETFPYELLIQHQSVCDLNPSMTPRVQTPADPSRRKRSQKHNVLAVAAQDAYEASLRSNRHQGMPTWVGDDDSGDEVIDHMNDAQTHTGAANGVRNHGSSRNSSGSSLSVASKYGAPPSHFDDYLTKGARVRTRDVTGHVTQHNRGSGRREESRRGSDARTRLTLDELLNTETEHDLLGSVGNSKKKSAKNEDNYTKKGYSPSTVSKRKPTPPTGTSTRDVMRELSRTSNTTQVQKPKKRANGNVGYHDDMANPPFDIRPVGSRQRTTHVFNPDARSRLSQPKTRTRTSGLQRFDDNDNI